VTARAFTQVAGDSNWAANFEHRRPMVTYFFKPRQTCPAPAIGNATPEPLLPIEKKLIAYSLAIGLALLAVLAAVNHFVPAAF